MEDPNAVAIKPETFLRRLKRVRGPSTLRRRRLLAHGSTHPIKNGLKGDDGCRVARTGADVTYYVPTGYRAASLRNLLIPADVVRIVGGVNNETDRFVGKGPDRRQDAVAHSREPGIHEQDTGFANLDGNVGSSTDQHVDIALHWQDVDNRVRLVAALLCAGNRSRASHSYQGDGCEGY